MLARLAEAVSRRPRRTLALVLVLTTIAGAVGTAATNELEPYNGDPDPGAKSARAAKELEAATGVDPRGAIVALVDAGVPVRSPAGRRRIDQVAVRLAGDSAVGRVVTPFGAAIARDGRTAYLLAYLRPRSARAQRDTAERLLERFENERGVTLGGGGVGYFEATEISAEDLASAERVAFPLLLVAALIAFRGFVASLVPLFAGLLSIGWTLGLLRMLGEMMSVSVFALNLVTALGIGLAIDFSLLLTSRFREELGRRPPPDALRATLASAGRTVAFSSLTIATALAALLVFPQRLLYSLGLAGLLVSLMTAAVSLVATSALLAILGPRVNDLAPRRLRRAAEREARPATSGGWYRLARAVTRRPVRFGAATAVLLLLAAAPVLGLRVTSADTPTALPEDADARRVEDALRTRFEPYRTTPVRVVVRSRPTPAVRRYAALLGALPGAASVATARAGQVTAIEVVSRSEPFSDESQDLVRRIRAEPAPAPTLVGGDTAAFLDQGGSIESHALPAIAIAVLASLLVLFLLTGSVVLPVKTVVMNALTVCATFGLLVLIFQDGRLEDLLGYASRGALVDPGVLVYVAALAFGLSTDYAVMLLSRIHEAVVGGATNAEATALGLERTGRIVTAAAVLFAVAVGTAATSRIIAVKEATAGVILAVLIDASLVRSLLVPSLMTLLGRANWWAPGPLRTLHGWLAPRPSGSEAVAAHSAEGGLARGARQGPHEGS